MKIKKGMVFKICTAIIGLIFLIVTGAKSQDFLHEDDYDKKTKQGIVLVEFWASFNSVNEINLKKIKEMGKVAIIMGSKSDFDIMNEAIEILKEADIIITNPPFSLFREYVAQLIEYNKKFIIIGNMNAISYKEIFKLIKDNIICMGFTTPKEFLQPDGSIKKFGNIGWFTNIETKKQHEDVILYKNYNKTEYSKYDNYDAINVDKVKNIPLDFEGVMGVPITFINKYNPNQFEIIGLGISNSGKEIGVKPYTKEHKKFRKEIQKRAAVDGDLYMIENNEIKVPYSRILIKNKNPKKL